MGDALTAESGEERPDPIGVGGRVFMGLGSIAGTPALSAKSRPWCTKERSRRGQGGNHVRDT